MIQNSFASCGIKLPRTAATQAKVGTPVSRRICNRASRPVFLGFRHAHRSHRLYMGDGLFVHASGSGRKLWSPNCFRAANWNIFVGARR